MQLLYDQRFLFLPMTDNVHTIFMPCLGPAPATQVLNTIHMGGSLIDPQELHHQLLQPCHQVWPSSFFCCLHTLTIVFIQLSGLWLKYSQHLTLSTPLYAYHHHLAYLLHNNCHPRAKSVMSGMSSFCTNTSSPASTGYTTTVDKHDIV